MRHEVQEWLLDHESQYEARPDLIRAGAEALGRHYDTVGHHLRKLERAGQIRRKDVVGYPAPPTKIPHPVPAPTPTHHMNIQGISREQAKLKHDIPARIEYRLREFVSSMEAGFYYEESVVRRACNVARDEEPYWLQITSSPEFVKYHGITEAEVRLWGLEDDMRWAAREMTGFRRSM